MGCCGLYESAEEPLIEIWSPEYVNKLVEREVFIIPCGESVPSSKINFCSRLLRHFDFTTQSDTTNLITLQLRRYLDM